MRAIGREPKDFWTGILFVTFGVAAIFLGRHHAIGTTMRMGPGAFPALLGVLLIGIGIALVVRSSFRSGPAIERITFLRPGLILLSVAAFALLLEPLGVVGATLVLVIISALASRHFRIGTALVLGIGLGVGCAIVFAWALGLPIPILGSWIGG